MQKTKNKTTELCCTLAFLPKNLTDFDVQCLKKFTKKKTNQNQTSPVGYCYSKYEEFSLGQSQISI